MSAKQGLAWGDVNTCDDVAFAAQTLGVEHAGSGSELAETRWRLTPIAGKTRADVAGPSDLALLRDDP